MVTAVGLASSVLAFITFSTSLVKGALWSMDMDVTLGIRMQNGGGSWRRKTRASPTPWRLAGDHFARSLQVRYFVIQVIGSARHKSRPHPPSQHARRTSRCRTKHTGCCLQRIGLDAAHHQRERSHWSMTGQRQVLGGKHTGCKDWLTELALYLGGSKEHGNDWAGMRRRLQASGYIRGLRVERLPTWYLPQVQYDHQFKLSR